VGAKVVGILLPGVKVLRSKSSIILNNWDGGRALRGKGCYPSPVLGVREYHLQEIFENIGVQICNWVHFGVKK